MSRFTYALFALAASLAILNSCQKQDSKDSLYQDLLIRTNETKALATDLFMNAAAQQTRGGESYAIQNDNEPLIIPNWAYSYFEEFTKPDDIASWDVQSICQSLSLDEELDLSQKEYIADLIGTIDSIKDNALSFYTPTRLSEEDCYEQFMDTCKEAIIFDVAVGATAGGIVAGYFGTMGGVIGGLFTAWREVREAGRAYIRCTAGAYSF